MLASVQTSSQTILQAVGDFSQTSRRLSDTSSEPGDTFEKSAFASLFGKMGLSSASRIEATSERIDFNFLFTSSTTESLSASGYVAQREQHASLTLNYTFQRAVIVDGKRELKSFMASIAIEADTSESLSAKPFKEKEDILHFLNRLMSDIMDLMQDDSQVLTGISLDQGDLAELMNLDKGRVRRLFDALMASIMTMAMLKRMKRGAEAGPDVILREKRGVSEGITAEKQSAGNLSFSIDIKEIASQQSLPKNETAASKETAASAPEKAQTPV